MTNGPRSMGHVLVWSSIFKMKHFGCQASFFVSFWSFCLFFLYITYISPQTLPRWEMVIFYKKKLSCWGGFFWKETRISFFFFTFIRPTSIITLVLMFILFLKKTLFFSQINPFIWNKIWMASRINAFWSLWLGIFYEDFIDRKQPRKKIF